MRKHFHGLARFTGGNINKRKKAKGFYYAEERMKVKDPGKREICSFCFQFEDEGVWDGRVTVELGNESTNYFKISRSMHLIKQASE